MPESVASAVAVKFAIEAIRRVPSSGLARIRNALVGKEILVIGPSGAGKSSWVDYLRFGVLIDEGGAGETFDIKSTPSFKVELGRNAALELTVRRVTDLPGQFGPAEHARLLVERNPHAVVLVCDIAGPLQGRSRAALGPWLRQFTQRLATLVNRKRVVPLKLRAFLMLLNKVDKLSRKDLQRRRKTVADLLISGLKAAGLHVETIPVQPTVLVTSGHGTRLADAAVVALARCLAN